MTEFEDDYSWLPNLEEPVLIKDQEYFIKSGNNWELMTYVGFDPKHEVDFRDQADGLTYPVHIFKNKYGTSYKSVSYVEELVSKGFVKYYDSEFNFYQELKIKKINIQNLRPNFVIIFKNGVDVTKTYRLQEELLRMGYKWHSKGKRVITPNDIKEKVFTIESLNWDTSNRLYTRMDSTFGDRKIIMLSTMENKETEQDKERRLNFIHDHPRVQVIDGDDLISKI
jgi:hypothetical protein